MCRAPHEARVVAAEPCVSRFPCSVRRSPLLESASFSATWESITLAQPPGHLFPLPSPRGQPALLGPAVGAIGAGREPRGAGARGGMSTPGHRCDPPTAEVLSVLLAL